ncbi:CoA transferase [Pseudomaricurvus sp.]|uniref:CoA transferase n=1 Tax=Pseudomaricurvus sp. TaxID=2004510 RepID=UPI003F6C1CDA
MSFVGVSSAGDQSCGKSESKAVTPAAYARILLDSLGLNSVALAVEDTRSASRLWADSGAMWLTGLADDEPRACPAPLAASAQGAWLALASLFPHQFDPDFDAHRLLGERAAIAGLSRQGTTSAGGACHLFKTLDGYLALNLAREDDHDLLHAWLEQPAEDDQALKAAIASNSTDHLVERARMMGLAAAPVAKPEATDHWFRSESVNPSTHTNTSSDANYPVRTTLRSPLVIDLTSLWAGPLCGSLLAMAGARVIKVESTKRPDGARQGPADFYHLMNSDKESVALDLSCSEGQAALRTLMSHADIVLEAARPRGLEQMGIMAKECIAARPGMTWLSITGYGRGSPMRDWIAYGDDAGMAAGLGYLMQQAGQPAEKHQPVFCGDAIADPLTGLHAALLALSSWRSGGGQLLDISLVDVVSHCIGNVVVGINESPDNSVARPVARTPQSLAAELGRDTARIMKEFS